MRSYLGHLLFALVKFFQFFFSCFVFFKIASHLHRLLPFDDTFCPGLFWGFFFSAASHFKCTRFILALREINVFSRCQRCPDWNKSPGRRETRWAEPAPPFGLSKRSWYLCGCAGLSRVNGTLDRFPEDRCRCEGPNNFISLLCFSSNKHRIVELRMGAPPFGLVVFAR